MTLISSVYLFLVVFLGHIHTQSYSAWEVLVDFSKLIFSFLRSKMDYWVLWLISIRHTVTKWIIPFSVAMLIALGTLYIVQCLQKEVEAPNKEALRIKALLPRWSRMKTITGRELTPSMQQPELQLEREMQIVELLVLLNLYDIATKGDDFVLKRLAELHAIDRIPNINQTFDFKFDPGRSTTQASALMIASKNGFVSVVDFLLMHPDIDVNLEAPEFGSTALMWASYKGHLAVVKRLLAVPEIDYNHQGKLGWTAFIGACTNSYVAVVRELLKMPYIDVNAADDEGFTGLIWAVSNGNAAIVQLLLSHPSTDINIATKFGITAFKLAQIKGHRHIMDDSEEWNA